jgi:dTDP-4-dehydrorhamnose reductase
LREKILLTISTWGIKTFLKIAILGSGPIPNLLAQELNSSVEIELFTSQNVEIDGINVSDYQSLLTSKLDFDVVILAWRGMPKAETEKTDVIRHIVKRASSETLIINLSSVSVYGQNSDVNFESTAPRPINSYGYSKYYLERYLNIFAVSKVCNLRISNVFGHPDFSDVLNKMILSVERNESINLVFPNTVSRDLISINKVTKVVRNLTLNFASVDKRELFNLSSEKTFTLMELKYLVETCLNKKIFFSEIAGSPEVILKSMVANNKITSFLGHDLNFEKAEISDYIQKAW